MARIKLIQTISLAFVMGLYLIALNLPAYAQPTVVPKVYKIAFITFKPDGFHNLFWDALQAGARKAAEESNIQLTFKGLAPQYSDKKVEGQTALFNLFIQEAYDGIIFAPSDRIRMAGPVKQAVIAGLKVIAVDSAVETPFLSGVFGTNNYEGGRKAAQALATSLNKEGQVLLLAHPTRDNKATRDRELAFAAEMRNSYPQIQIVSADRTGGATLETDIPAVRQLLDDFPQVTGVYGISGTGLEAFMTVVEERKLSGTIKIVGWDASPQTLEGMRRGSVSAIIQQNPENMAYSAVKAMVEALQGRESKLVIDTGVMVITRDNMDTAKVRALIRPDYSAWVR